KQGIAVSVVFFDIHCFSFEKVSTNNQGIIDSDSNNNTYTTYFLKSAQDAGVAPITQEVTSSVFALNYDLFIANFNSLNKRMGDLRNNPYSQGAWGRIFNGQLSNDFGRGLYSDSIAKFSYLMSDFNAKAKSLMMLRTRVGTTVGYDFKQFTQGKGVNASLYAGLSYQYRS
ncbi:autotransporter outer membrane beta-barrel domain-containing protein, partial [uncultured Helicobacter sp.]|uniref:autotransporter outer membrane beta-barrel domain-containing protein n=1 Tax=uncultured Helicobacter sp. TaxID=175537 RepID=UPI0026218304